MSNTLQQEADLCVYKVKIKLWEDGELEDYIQHNIVIAATQFEAATKVERVYENHVEIQEVEYLYCVDVN